MHRYGSEERRSSLSVRALKGLALAAVVAVLVWHVVEGWSIATWIGDEYLAATPGPSVDDAAVIGLDDVECRVIRLVAKESIKRS